MSPTYPVTAPFPLLYLDSSPASPPENLAMDEALLEWSEAHPEFEVLRFWESPVPFVVLGRSGVAAADADLEACSALGVPVLRRCSGGGAVVQGPGCLNYALVLRIDRHPELHTITSTNQWIMERHRSAIASLTGQEIAVAGITDLVWQDRKICGNAQKRGRTHLLFHGTFLLRFELDLIGRILRPPTREPAYRGGRPHSQFVVNLVESSDRMRLALRQCWNATTEFDHPLGPWLDRLLQERYLKEEWHRRY